MPSAEIGSQLTDSGINSQQLFTVGIPGILAVEWRARAANSSAVYLGSDSAAKSSGMQLLPGDAVTRVYHPVEVKATTFWVFGGSSTDRLDWEVLRAD